MELARLAIVYIHLIACCIALGLVFMSDLAMVKQLFNGRASTRFDPAHLAGLHKTVSFALGALWVTGAAIVSMDFREAGLDYFANPKLQAKIAIVCVLTLNGLLLYRAVMPALTRFGTLLNLPFSRRMLAIFAGSVSAASWFYAALLGVGRPLNWKYPLVDLLAMYPLMIVGGTAMMVALTRWAKYRIDHAVKAEDREWIAYA